MFWLNWQLGIISCIGLTFCVLAPAKISQTATEQNYQLKAQERQIANVVQENILSQSVVKYLVYQTELLITFSRIYTT